jgi:hypothetical protein
MSLTARAGSQSTARASPACRFKEHHAPVTFEATQAAIVLDTLSFRQIAILSCIVYTENVLYIHYT